MTVISMHLRRRPGPALRNDNPAHHFVVGQAVRRKHLIQGLLQQADVLRITRLLPPLGDCPQYRIRNGQENYERVSAQDELQPLSAAETAAAFEGGTFDHA